MPKPFRGVVNVDIRDSVPDWEPYLQPKAPEGAPNVLTSCGTTSVTARWSLRRPDRDAQRCGASRSRAALLELPHDGALFADAFQSPHRTQRHEQQHGVHHRGRVRLPRLLRAHPVRERHDRRGAERARLEHLRVGKWHLTPARRDRPVGVRRARWPLGRGFERYYGFLGGETNQWYPDLVYDNHTDRRRRRRPRRAITSPRT